MKDIDFDELDKAVNSLMGSVPAATPDSKPADAGTSVLEGTTSPVEPVSMPSPAPVSDTPAAPALPATSNVAPAQRRGGRFMDVVHPSSDMKTQPRTAAPPSRQGMTITPRPSVETTESVPKEPEVTPQSSAWPDPIEISAKTTTDTPESVGVEESTSVAPTVPEQPAADTSSESPFLSDAKVEKRPLNAGLPTDLASQLEESEESQPEKPKTTDTASEPVVPAELNSDLVAIESGEPTVEVETKDPVPLDHRIDDHIESKAAPAPTGPASISQQYKEQPSSGDQSHAAIYDTEHHPEPLAHPAKKKSGWLWIIWVLLLLAIGAGGAVALYLTGII